jgi:potassium-dependent mechanosensitive channel
MPPQAPPLPPAPPPMAPVPLPPPPPPPLSISDPQSWVDGLLHAIVQVWNYEIFSVEGQSLGFGRLLIGCILIVLGVALSRRISTLLNRRVFARFELSMSARSILQTLTFYILLLFFTLTGLNLANVPLTVFAFLGGALAIGIGFGSQNVVNNFISGIILMIEQPIKPGDLIEVTGTFGFVERIGARSTTVRTPKNTHILMPNSALLENSVSNWTLQDHRMRDDIHVGVAYGSDVNLVRQTLMRCAKDQPNVLPAPSPEVFFVDFGASSLDFKLIYWLNVNRMIDLLRVQSDIRAQIDTQFREAAITIPFPQRDVHIQNNGDQEAS